MRRIMVVFGTRPEAIKLAPLVLGLRDHPRFDVITTVTAQHRGLLDQVLDVFGIVPDDDLDILQTGQTLVDVTTRALTGLVAAIERDHPDAVVVQGDTTTAFAGALGAFYAGVPVAHVEAGLRSGDIHAPFPEEMNRRLTTQLTALHLAPTPSARDNLVREGVPRDAVVVTGNTVIDALRWAVAQDEPFTTPALTDLDTDDRPVLLVTAHRRESWGAGMRDIAAALRAIAEAEPGLLIVFPIHPNPVVRDTIVPVTAGLANVRIIEPLAYGEFARLIARSTLILTDSGGLQEEGPSVGKPVLVMRDVTERPEAVASGNVALVGTDRTRIVGSVLRLLRQPHDYARMAGAVNPYGDGRAVSRCMGALLHLLDGEPPPEEFRPETPIG
ncbi:MAG TPA: UDP-N-acetylglucosamine 2-epimerase (non-hydrolyzing) [Acidimicrobiales bacterium]